MAGLVQVACLVRRAEADLVSNSVLPLTSRLAQCAVMVTVMLAATSYYEIQLIPDSVPSRRRFVGPPGWGGPLGAHCPQANL